MDLLAIRHFHGPSYFWKSASLVASFRYSAVASASESLSPDQIEKLVSDKLISLGVPHDFAVSRAGVPAPTVIETICSVLRHFLDVFDLEANNVEIVGGPEECLYHIIVEDTNKVLTDYLLSLSLLFVDKLLLVKNPLAGVAPVGEEQVFKRVKQLYAQKKNFQKKRTTLEMQSALLVGDIPWIPVDYTAENRNLLQIGFGKEQTLLEGTVTFGSSFTGVEISISKQRTLDYLAELGFPVPQQLEVRSADQACRSARGLGFPVVLKSEFGMYGKQVYADLRSEQEIIRAFSRLERKLSRHSRVKILLEKHIPGKVYRVELVMGRIFDAYHMIPAHVQGNGLDSVRRLIELENMNPLRKDKSVVGARLVTLSAGRDEEVCLMKQGLGFDSVPAEGQTVWLSSNSNWSAGGDFVKVTEQVHPENARLLENVASQFQVELLGLDIITSDISQSFRNGKLKVLEVNHSPGIYSHDGENTGVPTELSKRLVKSLAGRARYGNVPVITVLESRESPVVVSALESYLNRELGAAAVVDNDSLRIGGEYQGARCDANESNLQLQLIRNNRTGSILVERSSQSLLEYGFGTGGCDVLVVPELAEGRISSENLPDGLAEIDVIKKLAACVRLACVVFVKKEDELVFCESVPPDRLVLIVPCEGVNVDSLVDAGAVAIFLGQTETREPALRASETRLQERLESVSFDRETVSQNLLVSVLEFVLE